MKKLISLLQGQKTAREKVIILEDRRKNLMAEILEFEDLERPTAPLKKKLADLDGDIEIAKKRAEMAKAKAFGCAEGLIDDDVKNYDKSLKEYQALHADFQERVGDCLAEAVFCLSELREMGMVSALNKIFVDAFDVRTPGLDKVFEIFKRGYEPKPGEDLSERRDKLQQIEMVKKSLASKSDLANKLIRKAQGEVDKIG